MTKVIIQLTDDKYGKYISHFTKLTMGVTNDINRAGKYSLKVAQGYIDSKKLSATIQPIS